MWQVPNGRWSEIPRDHLPPSILVREKRFYIHEVAVLEDHRWVIPDMWIVENEVVHADCQLVTRNVQVCKTLYYSPDVVKLNVL